MGVDTPHVVETFWALGELTYGANFGSLMYLQRQGFCSFNLVQHADEGGWDEIMAGAHGFSSMTLHVTASAINNSPTKMTSVAAKMELPFFILQNFLTRKSEVKFRWKHSGLVSQYIGNLEISLLVDKCLWNFLFLKILTISTWAKKAPNNHPKLCESNSTRSIFIKAKVITFLLTTTSSLLIYVIPLKLIPNSRK